MNLKKQRNRGPGRLAAVGGLLAAVVFVAGCRSVGYEKSDATADSMRRAAMAIQDETQGLRSSLDALETLVNQPAPDLRPQFKAYEASLDRLHDAVGRADTSIEDLQKDAATYFAAWERETDTMSYEMIRDHADARRTTVTNELATLVRRYHDSRAVVMPLLVYFDDIRKTLGADLTMDGLASVKGIVARTGEATGKVEAALVDLTTELSASGNRLASVGGSLSATGNAPPTNPTPVSDESVH